MKIMIAVLLSGSVLFCALILAGTFVCGTGALK